MAETTATIGPLVLGSGRRTAHYYAALQEFLLEFIQKALEVRRPYEPIWSEAYSNFTVAPAWDVGTFRETEEEKQFRSRSTLKDPGTHQAIQSLTSQSIGLLLGVRDYLQAIPLLIDDPEVARLISRVLMGTLETPGTYRTLFEEIQNAYTYGTAILELGYDRRARKQPVLEPTFDPATGLLTGKRFALRDVVFRNGPAIRGVDLHDFYWDPDGTRIQHNMRGAAKRFRVDRTEFDFLRRRGTYNVSNGINRILGRLGEPGSEGVAAEEEAANIGGAPRSDRMFEKRITVNKFGKMVGFEYWGLVPFKTPDGANNRVVTMLGGEIVRDHVNPRLDGQIPFKELITNPVAGRFPGLGAAEVVRFLQDSADNFMMALSDAANQAIRPTLLAGAGFNADLARLKRRIPGDIIDVFGSVDQLTPVPNDLGALQFALLEMARRQQLIKEATGATSPLQSIPLGGRATATEANLLFATATQRVGSSVMLMERDDFPWLGRGILTLLRQFADSEGMVATFEGKAIPFSLEDIDFESDVRFVGSRHSRTKDQILQATQVVISTLGAAPELLFLLPQVIVRMMRDGLEIDDAEKIAEEARGRFLQMRQIDAQIDAQGGARG